MRLSVLLPALVLLAATPALAETGIVRTQGPNADSPIAAAVTVPAGAETVYLSGTLASVIDPNAPKGSVQAYGDTQAQALSVLGKLKATLEGLGYGMGDVVQAHVFLAGDPNKGGDIDFAGLQAAWTQYFGTVVQPNKPARSTVKVAALVLPGALVEIEVTAAKVKH
ncbi:enamine deaminase RidA (YjgF/YER057c/UK114 family) [Nitrospirillum amazonense]|uniref:Enamine deaminase RidA (YjgF/YER057c/UK114 family) n=1 Tax=Nitrospirillum amazonense TaxID=28077 RepID=A0A560JGR5_9PROT|nr:RidA family protein [Nitrospirillum amazonense]TWB69729.1 enamine deaminase RidA (YjgF/YER057c/UK114 family) [Nitrospirillum amazonense]